MTLARAGAAATIIAIGFALHECRGALERSEGEAYEAIGRVMIKLPLTGDDSLRRVGQKLESNTSRVARTITLTHAIVLMVATFVWGLGDLATTWK